MARPGDPSTRWYQATAEVSSFVIDNGSTAYRMRGVSGVDLINRTDEVSYVAWAMVVFYRLPGDPQRNLSLFDGLDAVAPGAPASATIAGFRVPKPPEDA